MYIYIYIYIYIHFDKSSLVGNSPNKRIYRGRGGLGRGLVSRHGAQIPGGADKKTNPTYKMDGFA